MTCLLVAEQKMSLMNNYEPSPSNYDPFTKVNMTMSNLGRGRGRGCGHGRGYGHAELRTIIAIVVALIIILLIKKNTTYYHKWDNGEEKPKKGKI